MGWPRSRGSRRGSGASSHPSFVGSGADPSERGAVARFFDQRKQKRGVIAKMTPRSREGYSALLSSQTTVPWVMAEPASTDRPVTTPSLCAVTGFSIFMASSTTTRSPAATV